MNTDIRKYIKKNFKNTNIDELKSSIEDSINQREEVTLPGLGVFFEIVWKNIDSSKQSELLNILESSLR